MALLYQYNYEDVSETNGKMPAHIVCLDRAGNYTAAGNTVKVPIYDYVDK